MPTLFFVENDALCDDWCAFPSLEEAQVFIRKRCLEIAQANVDEAGRGNCPAFQGLTLDQIVAQLYSDHVGSVEQRDTPTVTT